MNLPLIDKDIAALKGLCEGHREIAFAFLFGSQAKGKATKLSDVDIAAYFYPLNRHPVQHEEEVYYGAEDDVQAGFEGLLKREVELLVLNRVPAAVAAGALRGMPLAINDWGLYIDFMETVTDAAEGFMNLIISDYEERSFHAAGA